VAAAKLAWMTLLHEKTKRVLAPGGLLFQVPPRSGCRMPLAESDYLHPFKSSTYGNVGAFSFCISRSFVAVSAFYNVSFCCFER
jgi:hypothetical protein